MLTFLHVIFMFEIYFSMLQFFLKWQYMSSLRRWYIAIGPAKEVIFLGSITTIQISSILVHSTCGPSYHRCTYIVHADDVGPSKHNSTNKAPPPSPAKIGRTPFRASTFTFGLICFF
jgi:hypothetical protein